MKFLLDTHIWLWALQNPEKLCREVRRALQKSSHELYLSPVSIWEAHHLERRGRLRLKGPFSQWIDEALTKAPLREAPFTFAVVRESARMITGDSQLLACSWLKTLPNQ